LRRLLSRFINPASQMKARLLVPAVLLVSILAGCDSTPMTYEQYKKEQADKLAFKRAGQEYKSPSQLKKEAAEMNKTGDETTFKKDAPEAK
jgi:hypothetical protein